MMLFPERMLFVSVLALRDDAHAVTRALAAEGSFHVVDQREQPVADGVAGASGEEDLLRACDTQAKMAAVLVDQLGGSVSGAGAGEATDAMLSRDARDLVETAQKAVAAVHAAMDALLRRRREIESKIELLDDFSEELHLLNDGGLSLDDLAGIRRLHVAFGMLPRRGFDELSSRLEGATYHLVSRPRGSMGVSILLLGDPSDAERFDHALPQVGFRPHDIPERFQHDTADALDRVEREIWMLRDELADANREFKTRRGQWIAELSDWVRALDLHSRLLEAMRRFGSVGTVTVISGFVPAARRSRLLTCLDGVAPGRYVVESFPAEEGAAYPVPTKLHNRALFRPFELFVTNYGLPRYNDIDPTLFVALSFLAMFGMMFGDVGHGAVLVGIGACLAYLPYRALSAMRSLGRILLMAGVSGALFGFLFGSVFGIEEDAVLPALWMRPSHQEHLIEFLGVALTMGAGIISLGIMLSVVQALRQGHRVKAWAGQWSLSSLAFYWMLLGLLGVVAAGKHLPFPAPLVALVVGAPLIVILAGQFLAHRFGRGVHAGEAFEPATWLFEPVEIVMNLFTNSISFLRVAAFGLAHAALMMATLIIKDMVRVPGVDFISMPVEHLFIIVLEGMIVTIQCLRLEYYEFFSKFFNGDGLAYAPLSVRRR